MQKNKQTNKQTKNSAYKFVSCFSSRFGGGTRGKGEEEREGKGREGGTHGERRGEGTQGERDPGGGMPMPPLPIRPMTLTPK